VAHNGVGRRLRTRTSASPRRTAGIVWCGCVLEAVVLSAAACASPGAPQPTELVAHASTSTASSSAPAIDRDCAQRTLTRLTPSERAGQVLLIGAPVDAPTTVQTTIHKYHPAGVFLSGRSKVALPRIVDQIASLQKTGRSSGAVPFHIAADQEGGRVQTLRGPEIGTIPSALEQGRWSADLLEQRTRTWSHALRKIGVTLNLAPVSDTVPAANPRSNPPIGALNRQYGADPDAVAAHVAVVVHATQDARVQATLKHFPGLGRVTVNTDFSAHAVDPTATPDDEYLRPFAKGIAAGAGAVMMSSARYPRLDAHNPAVFSSTIISMLRTRLGFDGLVMSDDLGPAKAVQSVPVGQRAVTFITAGGDLVLTVREKDAAPMHAAVTAAARQSSSFRARLDDAVLHVLESKHRAGLLPC
jgi:beta-N-acetylhexosaminidase